MSIDIPFPADSLFVKLLYEISILPVPSKLVPAIVLIFASLSAVPAVVGFQFVLIEIREDASSNCAEL